MIKDMKLELPISYTWNTLYIIIELLIIIMLILVFYTFYYERLFTFFKKTDVFRLKDIYIKKLKHLLNNFSESDDVRNSYMELSNLIREFVAKTTEINVSTLSKNEIAKLGIKELELLMNEYYPPEFSKYSGGDFEKSIKKTIELIKKWNS